jgi:hypothetical protein
MCEFSVDGIVDVVKHRALSFQVPADPNDLITDLKKIEKPLINFVLVWKTYVLTLRSFRSASLPGTTWDTKNPVPNSRPPLNENPNVDVGCPINVFRPLFACGRTNLITRIFVDGSQSLSREQQKSLELVEPCMLLQSVIFLLSENMQKKRYADHYAIYT